MTLHCSRWQTKRKEIKIRCNKAILPSEGGEALAQVAQKPWQGSRPGWMGL